jgi:hypothetical protein
VARRPAFTIKAQVTDTGGLTAVDMATVNVIWAWSGPLAPVDPVPTLNLVKGGAGVPVKFSLGGDQGLAIMAAGYPKSQQIVCDSSDPVDGVEETVTAGSSSLRYDPGTGQYIYVWKTEKTWAGTCRALYINLTDGTTHRAEFKFTK